ncbi:MAG: hypothetical protein ABJB49_08220 [Nitrospirota bacterium]
MERLIGIAVALSLGHNLDHVIREHLFSFSALVPLFILSGLFYGTTRPWGSGCIDRSELVHGSGRSAPAWDSPSELGHFSPFTDQSVTAIFRAYESSVAGALAVLCLIALMMTLVMIVRWSLTVRHRGLYDAAG